MIKVGLIGCGFMGGMHSACYKEIDGAEVVAVADVRGDYAQQIADMHNAKVYKTGEELIENADVDVVDICLPTYLHTAHAVKAMQAGRDVFIEKPVCLTKEEGVLLQKTADETGAKIQVGQVVRFFDEYKLLKDIVDGGEYGKIQTAVFKRLSSNPTWAWEDWLHKAEKSGSVALDMHVHDVDFMRYILGEPLDFHTGVMRDEKKIIEQVFTTFEYPDATVTVEACWDYPMDFPFTASFRVKFEKATIVFDSNGFKIYHVDGGCISPEIKPTFEAANDIGGNISSLGGYYNELRYFVDKLNAGETPTMATLEEGIKSAYLALDEIESVGGAQAK